MMNSILLKAFATALTLSQVVTRLDAVKTHFDPGRHQPEVARLLHDGCRHMFRVFDLEEINFDDLLSTAMQDPQALTAGVKALNGLNFNDLQTAYREYCKNEKVANSPVRLDELIEYYNKAVADLPDHRKLKGLRLPESSVVLDGTGKRFTEVYHEDNRRKWIPLKDIPDHVQKAFVAAEDKRFFQHKGVDERGILRAFLSNFQGGRPQGGSTITQQVAKNLLVGDDVTYERKMREMIVASRIERTLSKPQILEIYLNQVFLGRASWGVEMAARSWFGKSAKELTLAEAALLAALTKGPNYYSPDRHWDRASERLSYVLDRMREDAYITAEQMKEAQANKLRFAAYESPRTRGGFHFVDEIAREVRKVAGVPDFAKSAYTVKSTIRPELQAATEAALQEGLARYELASGRMRFLGPEKNLAKAVEQLRGAAEQNGASARQPAWLQALTSASLPLYDVHWPAAVVVEKSGRQGEVVKVGLKDGRVLRLQTWSPAIRRQLQLYDVVYVRVPEGRNPQAELRIRPTVQGAALVLDNRTGRILALSGGFSYALSQLDRAVQTERQPGSTLKPLTYLAALTAGLQPNTLVEDAPVSFPPIQTGKGARYWTPKNYDRSGGGVLTIRQALENSKNLVTARLLDGAILPTPEESLDFVCTLAKEAKIYESCVRYYPFILGAQPASLLNMAAFYAAIANEGARPTPHVVESIEKDGRKLYEHRDSAASVTSADRVAFYQLKTFLQGVVQRGTARQIRHLGAYVAGKTGTSDGENDAWFIGFTNDVTIAVWVGYDNAERRVTLGRGFTGTKVAIPIFEPILEATWKHYAPKTALKPPSPELKPYLLALPIDLRSGTRLAGGSGQGFTEYFRLSGSG